MKHYETHAAHIDSLNLDDMFLVCQGFSLHFYFDSDGNTSFRIINFYINNIPVSFIIDNVRLSSYVVRHRDKLRFFGTNPYRDIENIDNFMNKIEKEV